MTTFSGGVWRIELNTLPGPVSLAMSQPDDDDRGEDSGSVTVYAPQVGFEVFRPVVKFLASDARPASRWAAPCPSTATRWLQRAAIESMYFVCLQISLSRRSFRTTSQTPMLRAGFNRRPPGRCRCRAAHACTDRPRRRASISRRSAKSTGRMLQSKPMCDHLPSMERIDGSA